MLVAVGDKSIYWDLAEAAWVAHVAEAPNPDEDEQVNLEPAAEPADRV